VAGRAMREEGQPGCLLLLLLLLLSFLLLHPAAPSDLLKRGIRECRNRLPPDGRAAFSPFPAAQCGRLIPHPQILLLPAGFWLAPPYLPPVYSL
jgi:hypothetical protein